MTKELEQMKELIWVAKNPTEWEIIKNPIYSRFNGSEVGIHKKHKEVLDHVLSGGELIRSNGHIYNASIFINNYTKENDYEIIPTKDEDYEITEEDAQRMVRGYEPKVEQPEENEIAVSFIITFVDKKGRAHTITQPEYKGMSFKIQVRNQKDK